MNNKLSIEGLLKLIRYNLHILILWMVGMLAASAVFTFFVVEPEYQSTSKIVVNQMPSGSSSFTSSEIDTNLSLIDTYQGIILEPIILENVIQETGANDSVDQLRDKISFESEESSLIFGITVTDANRFAAADLANTTAEIFQNQIGEILPVESVTILSAAFPAEDPVSPNVNQNLLFGLMLGFFVGFMQIFLTDLLDKRVKSDEIISEIGWIHLGSLSEIPAKEVQSTEMPIRTEQDEKVSRVFPGTIKDYRKHT